MLGSESGGQFLPAIMQEITHRMGRIARETSSKPGAAPWTTGMKRRHAMHSS